MLSMCLAAAMCCEDFFRRFTASQCVEADHDSSLVGAQIGEKPPTMWHLLIPHRQTEFL